MRPVGVRESLTFPQRGNISEPLHQYIHVSSVRCMSLSFSSLSPNGRSKKDSQWFQGVTSGIKRYCKYMCEFTRIFCDVCHLWIQIHNLNVCALCVCVLTRLPVGLLFLSGLGRVVVVCAVAEAHCVKGAFICQSFTQTLVFFLCVRKTYIIKE